MPVRMAAPSLALRRRGFGVVRGLSPARPRSSASPLAPLRSRPFSATPLKRAAEEGAQASEKSGPAFIHSIAGQAIIGSLGTVAVLGLGG